MRKGLGFGIVGGVGGATRECDEKLRGTVGGAAWGLVGSYSDEARPARCA